LRMFDVTLFFGWCEFNRFLWWAVNNDEEQHDLGLMEYAFNICIVV
jgi:hypothetical protein